uniref:Venom peptide Htgkr23 n=1 Tax=Hadogenes troglodytes TaxID=1577150 RepID=A0A1B3IJA6_9SCOR|nr:venom peptide Htgkr23 [Hadogenes troglodytes]
MKTLPVIFLCLLILLAAPSGIWCGEETENQLYDNSGWKSFLGKRILEIISASQREDWN